MSQAAVTSDKYTPLAIALHWLLGAAIVATFILGIYMHDLPLSPSKLKLYNYHKWAGISILALSACRLLWRLTHQPPADPPMAAWQAKAAHLTHLALYALFFAVPLSGWAYSSAAGFPVVLFGVLPLPDFVQKSQELAEAIKPLHEAFALTLGVLVILHVAAALKHQFVDRDNLLARMRPGRG